MPQANPITLTDAATPSPASHVFKPSKVADLSATYYGDGQTLAGRENLVIDRREASSSVAGRVTYTVRQPIEKTSDGKTAVDHQNQISVTAVSASASTEQERANIWEMVRSLFANADAKAMFVKGEGVW